jgi:DNA-binding NtrC family response regulator
LLGRALEVFWHTSFYQKRHYHREAEEVQADCLESILSHQPNMEQVKNQIRKLAPTEMAVYIEGESGTGKELVAKCLHQLSKRSSGPYQAINCAQFNESLIESELFGHAKGAFTGADRQRTGVLESVDGGTLFLDEVADLTPRLQSLLLRVIQFGEFTRVGETRVRQVTVRLLSATHKPLKELVHTGLFRRDLFFRLVTSTIELPPLRERPNDLMMLLHHFLRQSFPGKTFSLSGEAQQALHAHHWPGNVREMESFAQKLGVFLDHGGMIQLKDVQPLLDQALGRESSVMASSHCSWQEHQMMVHRRFLQESMKKVHQNRTALARALGLSRQSLTRLLRQYYPEALEK